METHPVGIDDLHLADSLVEDLGFIAQEAEFHILGGEWVAIMELQPLAQLEFIDQVIGALRPGLRQAGGHRVVGHRSDQRVMQGIAEPEGGEADHGHLCWIEPGGGNGHIHGIAHLPFRLIGGRCCAEVSGQQDAHQTHDSQYGPPTTMCASLHLHRVPSLLWLFRDGGRPLDVTRAASHPFFSRTSSNGADQG